MDLRVEKVPGPWVNETWPWDSNTQGQGAVASNPVKRRRFFSQTETTGRGARLLYRLFGLCWSLSFSAEKTRKDGNHPPWWTCFPPLFCGFSVEARRVSWDSHCGLRSHSQRLTSGLSKHLLWREWGGRFTVAHCRTSSHIVAHVLSLPVNLHPNSTPGCKQKR